MQPATHEAPADQRLGWLGLAGHGYAWLEMEGSRASAAKMVLTLWNHFSQAIWAWLKWFQRVRIILATDFGLAKMVPRVRIAVLAWLSGEICRGWLWSRA